MRRQLVNMRRRLATVRIERAYLCARTAAGEYGCQLLEPGCASYAQGLAPPGSCYRVQVKMYIIVIQTGASI